MIHISLVFVFLLLSGIHFYWAAGGKWGLKASLPSIAGQKVLNPGIIACLVVALGLLGIALFISQRAGYLVFTIPVFIEKYATKILAVLFLIRAIGDFRYVGFSKTIKGTQFAANDTRYYSPLCVLISVLLYFS